MKDLRGFEVELACHNARVSVQGGRFGFGSATLPTQRVITAPEYDIAHTHMFGDVLAFFSVRYIEGFHRSGSYARLDAIITRAACGVALIVHDPMAHIFDGGFEGAVHDKPVSLGGEHVHNSFGAGQSSCHHDHTTCSRVLLYVIGQRAYGVFVGVCFEQPVVGGYAIFVEHHGKAYGYTAFGVAAAGRIDVVGVVESEGAQYHVRAFKQRMVRTDAFVCRPY